MDRPQPTSQFFRDNYDFPERNAMFGGGGHAERGRGRGRTGRGFNGGFRDWQLNRGARFDSRYQAQLEPYGGLGYRERIPLVAAWGGGPNSRLGGFLDGHRGFSSYGNPLWSDALAGDTSDYFDSEPVPF